MIDTPAPAAAPRIVYCLCHARPAVDRGMALDGRHRNVTHPISGKEDLRRPRSLVLGTLDLDEAATLVEARRRARALAEHGKHRTISGISRWCAVCLTRGAHLDHIEDRRLVAGCAECDTAQRRAWSAKVGR